MIRPVSIPFLPLVMRTLVLPARGAAASAAILASMLSGAALSSSVFAQSTHYTDVPAGAYYEDAAAALLLSGALDASENRLRPGDPATRAEVAKLLGLPADA